MNYTAPEVIAIIVALGSLIAGVGGVLVTIIMALKKEVVKVGEKASVIEAHVNSKQTADSAQIESLRQQLAMAKETLANNAQIAAVLAKSAAPAQPASAAPTQVSVVNPTSDPIPVIPQT